MSVKMVRVTGAFTPHRCTRAARTWVRGHTPSEIIGKHFSVFYPPDVAATGKCDEELAIPIRTRFEIKATGHLIGIRYPMEVNLVGDGERQQSRRGALTSSRARSR